MVVPSMVPSGMAQVPMAQVPMNGMPQVPMGGYNPGYNAYHQYPAYPYYNPRSLGNRFREFLGCAPRNVQYKTDRSSWGFMGYSHRQRYIDARTGREVDRHGRPVYRV